MNIEQTVAAQQAYFATDATKPLAFRKEALTKLQQAVITYRPQLEQALYQDLGKKPYESYMTETGLVLDEIRCAKKHLDAWARPVRVKPSIAQLPAKCQILAEPFGVCLIMSPWNYPVQLTLNPLIAAIAAGNCAVVKPSAYAPAVSQVIAEMLTATFDQRYISVIQGGRLENTALLEQKYDFIFFTGSVAVGKLVMTKAAANLTPVVLELGGKSPCIIDDTADLAVAARRIVFGKTINCGQTCVAPDYCWVDARVHDEFISQLRSAIAQAVGPDPLNNDEYPKMIDAKHYQKVMVMIDPAKTVCGGHGNGSRIEPTIIDQAGYDDACMQQEIFGLIIPVMTYQHLDQAVTAIKAHDKPLACYIFTADRRKADQFLSQLSFGGGCVNDTLMHLTSSHMPFGGVGASGMGSYHGHFGFDSFSHHKSIVRKGCKLDNPLRYHPYTAAKDKLVKLFMPVK